VTGLSCGECKWREWSSGEGVWWGRVVVSGSGGSGVVVRVCGGVE